MSQVGEVRNPVVLQVEEAELIHPIQVWAIHQATTTHTNKKNFNLNSLPELSNKYTEVKRWMWMQFTHYNFHYNNYIFKYTEIITYLVANCIPSAYGLKHLLNH